MPGSSPGSLILGGYDQAAFKPSNLEFQTSGDVNHALSVIVKSIVVADNIAGTVSVPIETGLNMTIDSTVSQLWLPSAICDFLADKLGLVYDADKELYTVNSSTRDDLLRDSPEFTFTLTANSTSTDSTDIVLPYAAFDLRASLPIYLNSTPYFPIRRATNESQYVLGRTFLQEAYIVVDWERGNFTLGQAAENSPSQHIVPILPRERENKAKGGLTAGTIVGVVVGVIGGVIAILAGIWLAWRSRKRASRKATAAKDSNKGDKADGSWYGPDGAVNKQQGFAELYQDDEVRPEIMSTGLYELQDERLKHQLMSNQLYELEGRPYEHELEAVANTLA